MGGSSNTSSSVKVPAWLSSAAQDMLKQSQSNARVGYTPYYGPDVAAMTPAQIAAMQGTNSAASAFGLPTVDVTAGMPAATDYNGISAYSSGAGYDAALAELKARFPGQFAAIMSQFVDPVTGRMTGVTSGQTSGQSGVPAQIGRSRSMYGNGEGGPGNDGPAEPMGGRSSTSGTGYTSIRDMFDGGGQGRSGSTFSGGLLSDAANRSGISPARSSQSSTVTRQSGR